RAVSGDATCAGTHHRADHYVGLSHRCVARASGGREVRTSRLAARLAGRLAARLAARRGGCRIFRRLELLHFVRLHVAVSVTERELVAADSALYRRREVLAGEDRLELLGLLSAYSNGEHGGQSGRGESNARAIHNDPPELRNSEFPESG